MTDSNQTPQVDIKQFINLATSTGFGLSITAGAVALIGFLLPFISVSTNLGLGMDQSGSLNGFEAAGWVVWLTLLVFVATILSWRVAQIAPYRTLLTYAGAALAVLSIIVALFFNPVSSQIAQATQGLLSADVVKFGPHVGMLFALFAGGILVWAGRKTA